MRRSPLLALAVIRTIPSSFPLSSRCEVLACLAQQQLRSGALPGMGQIAPRSWTHIHVDLAIFAHDLAASAENPHQQRALGARRRLANGVHAHLGVLGSELLGDEVAG